jgi:L-fuculokinase
MTATPAIAIFDIGKTNKKLFVFDEQYSILVERTIQFAEIRDEDGDACENLEALTQWFVQSVNELVEMKSIAVKALNFSAYGASFVHLDKEGKPAAPLYNYLKPFPARLKQKFYDKYGGEPDFSMHTASPVLGNLNSGLQLYYLEEEKQELFKRIQYSLHLPQYMSYLVTGRPYSDITSIGCHTALWNFTLNRYHEWLYKEGIAGKLAPIFPSNQLMHTNWNGKPLLCGAGLHDSSAALIPYLSAFTESFVLISTGTWCISLHPFNHSKLTAEELQEDCLCYMDYHGKAVKASRLFAGYEHELQVKRLAAHFNTAEDKYRDIVFDAAAVRRLGSAGAAQNNGAPGKKILRESLFAKRDLSAFSNYSAAYHQLMMDIISLQVASTNLVLKNCAVKNIFVDGGFGKNPIYMYLLAAAFPYMKVYSASLAQASAMGAALAVHPYWNKNNSPSNLIELKLYAGTAVIEL